MRILLVGVFNSGYALSGELRARALRELGHDVVTVDYRNRGPRSLRMLFPGFNRRQALANVLAPLRQSRVDLVIVLKGECFDPDAVRQIRAVARAPVVNWFPDDPHRLSLSRAIAPGYDLFFTHDTYAVEQLRTKLGSVRYLPFGCHPAVHRPYGTVENEALAHSVVFIGTYDPIRASVLQTIADCELIVAGPGWRPEHVPGATVWDGGLFGELMFQAFSNARISINIHQNFGSSVEAYGRGLNSRVFEVTGCAGVLLTDRKDDLRGLYQEGTEVVCYASSGELRERVYSLLQDDKLRRSLANSGRARAIAAHTLHHRFAAMLTEVGRLGSAA